MPAPAPTGRPRAQCSEVCKYRAYRKRKKKRRSESVEWYTPVPVFRVAEERWGPFTLDPCASPLSPLWPLVPHHFTREDDGLAQPWHGRVWMNPPYGAGIDRWTRKAAEECESGRAELVVALVPVKTDTGWWHAALEHGAREEFIKGRIAFLEPVNEDGRLILREQGSGRFASAWLVFRGAHRATKPPAPLPQIPLFPQAK